MGLSSDHSCSCKSHTDKEHQKLPKKGKMKVLKKIKRKMGLGTLLLLILNWVASYLNNKNET